MASAGEERYVHGYEEWTREWMAQRTAAREWAILLPHLRAGQAVLDVGCGPGSITADLAGLVDPGAVVGLDIEPRQLSAARELASARGVRNVTFQQGSVYELPFPDASFDVVTAHFVLEHVREPLRGLRELRRVLRPGGIVAIKDPYYPGFVFRPETPELVRALDLMARVREHSGASDQYAVDLRATLREAGFARTQAAAGVDTLLGMGGEPMMLRLVLGDQVREAAFRDTVLGQRWATEAELDEITAASEALARRDDLFGFVLFVTALGWVDA